MFRNFRRTRPAFRGIFIGLAAATMVFAAVWLAPRSSADEGGQAGSNSLSPYEDPNFPREFDVRAIHGTARGTDAPVAGLPFRSLLQLKAISSLKNAIGLATDSTALRIEYNGLTATPRHIVNNEGYLSGPSTLDKETIARNFLAKFRGMFRFSEDDLSRLKLVSRATSRTGTTTLLFNQRSGNLTVWNASVLVNIARDGKIISVGGDTFPQLNVTNSLSITPQQAIQNATAELGLGSFTPASMGTTQVLTTFGDLPHEFVTGQKFSRGTTFGDDIVVTTAVFPMLNSLGRIVYKFTLTTPQYSGVMWQHFVDAQTGEVLRRSSLTSFQKDKGQGHFGDPGGGPGVGRRGTFRPDVQNYVEGFNHPSGTARGKVFDTSPVILSGTLGYGRSARTGTPPAATYTQPLWAPDTGILTAATGRGFRYGQAFGRFEFPLPWTDNNSNPPETFTHAQLPGLLGQITRGFPDATNPTSGSPFGWFYLPTDNGGAEITAGNTNRSTTRAHGYSMDANAVTKNQAFPGNSPAGDGTQPFSADLTAIPTTNLPDGRTLSQVFQSRYTEGNNILTADDRFSDNEATHGIKGYSPNRQYTNSFFDYIANYEYTSGDAGGTPFFPASTDPDVPPGTVSLFYFNNILHDYLYDIGFTENFWNFQMDNFGRGGAGNDPVSTQVMDGSGTNNANMGTGDDGSPPRMQMFLFTEASQRRSDGSFDFDVVAHEQFHGVSNRSAAKGGSGCLGVTLVGESGGMGEGWGDWIAASMTDDDVAGDYVTGNLDRGIRKLPMTNYRFSYGAANNRIFPVRRTDMAAAVPPDQPGGSTATPFAVHSIGELWSSMLWDMRELIIMRTKVGGTFPGMFYDGNRRLGSGTSFYIGERQVQSVDTHHPINYRASFNSTLPSTAVPPGLPTPNIIGNEHFVRPPAVAAEIAGLGGSRTGPLSTAVSRGARLADQLMLRGLQLAPCNPSIVEMRDSIIAADREITGGENVALIWRAFTSHGVGTGARSTGGTGGTDPAGGAQSAPTIVEDFTIPATVAACEVDGPIAAPAFTVTNSAPNAVSVSITGAPGAVDYVVARSTSATGPFSTIYITSNLNTTDNDNGNGLVLGQTYYYQVHARRNADCVGTANTNSVTIKNGVPISPAPVFAGIASVADPRQFSRLNLSWLPATSGNPSANIVYDIYRVSNITSASGQTDSTTPPTFTPTEANRIAVGWPGLTYEDTGRTFGQVYYYIVQARDTANGKIDTDNTGNRRAKFNAPTSPTVANTAFALENFEAASANTRFIPFLTDSADPNVALPFWQRASNSNFDLAPSTAMYAPDFDPPADGTGAPSDINATIGPLTITSASILEFDSRHATEFAFDGGVIDVIVGIPGAPTTFPDNISTYDLNYFLIDNGYSGPLDGTLAGPVILSPLQGRYAFTGTRSTKHVRAALGMFAPGGPFNPASLPVYIRFRSVSDVGTSPGVASGWYIDNLVVNNYQATPTSALVSVAGRVTDSGDQPIRNVIVNLTNGQGEIKFAKTSSLGYYRIEGVEVGQTYTVTATHKHYSFGGRIVTVNDAVDDLNLTANP